MDNVIDVSGLRKSYGKIIALKGLHFQVRRGEIFGMVGPNGAGKTTTIDCIAGMRVPDEGSISVLGFDPRRGSGALRKRMGLQQQESELPERIRVIEAIELFSTLFGVSSDSGSILSRVGLSGKRNALFSSLSGGQKKRLFVALALVNDPELIILDELTSGLDPAGRRQLWALVEELRDREKTVVLSTHYMDEAQNLCDRIAVLDSGRVAALDTPEALVRKYCPGMILRLECGEDFRPERVLGMRGVSKASMSGPDCVMELAGSEFVVPVIQGLSAMGISLGNLSTRQPSLEDVFIAATGKEYSDEGNL